MQRDEVPDGDCFLTKRRDLEKEVEDLKRSLIIKVYIYRPLTLSFFDVLTHFERLKINL